MRQVFTACLLTVHGSLALHEVSVETLKKQGTSIIYVVRTRPTVCLVEWSNAIALYLTETPTIPNYWRHQWSIRRQADPSLSITSAWFYIRISDASTSEQVQVLVNFRQNGGGPRNPNFVTINKKLTKADYYTQIPMDLSVNKPSVKWRVSGV